MLAKMEGNWDTLMKANGMEFKGTITYKMDLGGLWLVGSMESELFGQKFSGRSMDTYDAGKKKFVGLWIDSMSTSPVSMEGTYDEKKKELIMDGQGPGQDGANTKYKSISSMPDDNTIIMKMFMGDAKEPAFEVTYKRKK
jgi:hypothetical protein